MNDNETLGPVLYYDGECNLCSRSVQFIVRHDKKGLFRFEPLQSENGKAALALFSGAPPDSLLLFYNNRHYIKSDAALMIVKLLGGFWRPLYSFVIVPRFLRDRMYDFIARNRYRWFGRADSCVVPREKNLAE